MDEKKLQESRDLANDTYNRTLARMYVNDAFQRVGLRITDAQNLQGSGSNSVNDKGSHESNPKPASYDSSQRHPDFAKSNDRDRGLNQDKKQIHGFGVPNCNINETMRKIKEHMDNISFQCECYFDSCPNQRMSRADKRHIKVYHKGVITPRSVKKKRKSKSKKKDDDSSSDSDSDGNFPKENRQSSTSTNDKKKSSGVAEKTFFYAAGSYDSSQSTSKQQGSTSNFQNRPLTPPNTALESGSKPYLPGPTTGTQMKLARSRLENVRDSIFTLKNVSKRLSTERTKSQSQGKVIVSYDKPEELKSKSLPQLDPKKTGGSQRKIFSNSADNAVHETSPTYKGTKNVVPKTSPLFKKGAYRSSTSKGNKQSTPSSSLETSVSVAAKDNAKASSSSASWEKCIYTPTKSGVNVDCCSFSLGKRGNKQTSTALDPSQSTSECFKEICSLAKDFQVLYPVPSPLVSGSDLTESATSNCDDMFATFSQMQDWMSEKHVSYENKQKSTPINSNVHPAGKNVPKQTSKEAQKEKRLGSVITSNVRKTQGISVPKDQIQSQKTVAVSSPKPVDLKLGVTKGKSPESHTQQGIQVLTKPGNYIVKKASADLSTYIIHIQPGQFIKLDLG